MIGLYLENGLGKNQPGGGLVKGGDLGDWGKLCGENDLELRTEGYM
jgi:hypothetical protein